MRIGYIFSGNRHAYPQCCACIGYKTHRAITQWTDGHRNHHCTRHNDPSVIRHCQWIEGQMPLDKSLSFSMNCKYWVVPIQQMQQILWNKPCTIVLWSISWIACMIVPRRPFYCPLKWCHWVPAIPKWPIWWYNCCCYCCCYCCCCYYCCYCPP